MAKKTNTSSSSVDSSQPNFLNFQPKTKREKDLYNEVNGRLQEFAAADPEYADVMENTSTSSEYTIPSAATAKKQEEAVPQEPGFSKKELEEKIQSEVKTEVQKEVQREVQKVVSQEVQKEVQRVVPQEVQKAVEKITPIESPKAVKEEALEDFEESKTEKLFIENNEQEVSEHSNYQENDSDNDSYDRMKRVILIIVFIGLLAAVIFFALRRCACAPKDEVVLPDTTMQQPKPEQNAAASVEGLQAKKTVNPGVKIEELKGTTKKSATNDANVSVQQPKKAVAKEPKTTQPKTTDVASTKTTTPKESVKQSTKDAEPVKVAEPTKEVEPVKVTEPVKITEITKSAESEKLEEPVKVAEPVAVPTETVAPKQEPATVIAKDLPFQEKNAKPKQAAPAPAKKPAAVTPAPKPTPKPKPEKAPVKVETTKSTTDDLKELEKVKESGPRICTPDKVPSQGYLISYSSTKNESTAIKTVMILTRNHFPCGYYWLGDSKTQKKSTLFRVFIGPYKTEAEAQAALSSIQAMAPDAKVYTEMPTKK